jgi:hypothetical protein
VVRQGSANGLQHRVDVLKDEMIPKPEHLEPLRVQPVGAPGIVIGLLRVLTAIKLDHQPALKADEVDNERSDRGLPSKPAPAELSVSQVIPEATFRVRQIFSQVAGEFAAHGIALRVLRCDRVGIKASATITRRGRGC